MGEVISDEHRVPITADKQSDGTVILRGPRSLLILSEAEMDRLVAFARDEPMKPRIQRYPVNAPESP